MPRLTAHWTHLLFVQHFLQLLGAVLLLVACVFRGLLLQPPGMCIHASKAPHICRVNCVLCW